MTYRRNIVFACCLLGAITLGCGSNAPSKPEALTGTPSATSKGDHHHGDAPHGGTIADWGGGKYHVEFTVDHDRQEATVYVLGSDARSSSPIATEKLMLALDEPAVEIELTAQPMEGESAGSSSRFVGQHEALGKVQEFAGTILGEIEGTPYIGDFQENGHAPEH